MRAFRAGGTWRSRVQRVVSRSLVAVIAGIFPAVTMPAAAQGNWWEGLQTGPSDYSKRQGETERPERKPEILEDLRSDATPWCSDVMFNAIGGAIERYESIAASGGWPLIPAGRMMRPGDDDQRVPVLRKRLRISGDMPAKGQYYDSESYDAELEAGVKRFQLRHGVRPTGRIEQSMYPVLNVTAAERVEQLKLNFERLRALAA